MSTKQVGLTSTYDSLPDFTEDQVLYLSSNLVWMQKLETASWWSCDRMRETLDLLNAYYMLGAVYSLYSLSCEGIFISMFQLRNLRLKEARILV